MLLMIDNYDSFTFNLVQYFCELGEEVKVVRNDEITLDEIAALKADRLVLSPGPCSPAEAGICVPALQRFAGQLPILGVCLGHQSIGAALGGRVVRARQQMHGKTSDIETDGQGVYAGLPSKFTVIRYHSLVIEEATMPAVLQVLTYGVPARYFLVILRGILLKGTGPSVFWPELAALAEAAEKSGDVHDHPVWRDAQTALLGGNVPSAWSVILALAWFSATAPCVMRS